MRSDMFKVIVERPRRGAGWERPGRHLPWELAPRQEPILPRRRGRKDLNENLKPLERFLRSRVGSRWDDVYAEISEHLNVRNAVQQHVRDHLERMVEKIVVERGGVLWSHSRLWPMPVFDGDLYVDPRTGVLRLQKPERVVARHPEPRELFEIDARTQWRVIDGLWFEIGFAPFPPRGEHYDVLERRALKWDIAAHRIRGERVLAVRKRQLGKRELREVARLLAAAQRH
ncbi:MAG: hypothetical protein JST92_06820 [Deltaproteobacteria bacterium]|nr:hypothetical protein [Deltaproteobacteria bacterium]